MIGVTVDLREESFSVGFRVWGLGPLRIRWVVFKSGDIAVPECRVRLSFVLMYNLSRRRM